MSIDLYKEKIQELKNNIDIVLGICEKYDDENHKNQLLELKQAVDEDVFRLLVVGEFSRGKSTLVNALLGKQILPADPNPTTVMLNVIREGNDEGLYYVHYKDGSVKELNREGFETITAKEPSPDKTQNENIQELYAAATKNSLIDYAEIIVNNDFGKLGIDIVDTPGMNDINTVREEVTLNYIPKADAAIIVCSALEPLSKSELKFIKDQLQANQITNLFVAVNYCDLLHTEVDRNRIYNHFKDGLNQIVAPERIKLVSAKKALKYKRQLAGENFKKTVKSYEESGFDSFESDILEHLAVERGAIKLQRFSSILARIHDELVGTTFEMRKQAIMLSRNQLEDQIADIKNKTKELEKRYKHELEAVSSKMLKKQADYSKEYEKRLRSMANAAMDKVDAYRGNDMGELYDRISDTIIAHKRKIESEFLSQIKLDIEKTFSEHIDAFGKEFSQIGLPSDTLQIQLKGTSNDITLYNEKQVAEMMASRSGGADGSVENFLLEAAVGAGLVALGVLMVTNPILFVGAAVVSQIGASASKGNTSNTNVESESLNNSSTVTNEMVKAVYTREVKTNYFSPIASNVSKFRKDYEASIHKIVEKIEQDCEKQMDNTRRQYEIELNNKADEKTEIQDRIEEINNDTNSLIDVKLWCGGVA